MKYMLLIYGDESVVNDEERHACYRESTAFAHQLHAEGKFLAASPLHSSSMATSLRMREGRRLLTDGPFAETREQLGGYFLVEAKDLDDALHIAERLPAAKFGTIEVRPIVEIPDLPMTPTDDLEDAAQPA